MKRAETKDRIRQALEIRGIKQSELVERTGIDKGQMSSYLSGKYKPRQKNIDLIAQTLSVNEAWLMGFDVPMERYGEDQNVLRYDAELEQALDIIENSGYTWNYSMNPDYDIIIKNSSNEIISCIQDYELVHIYEYLQKKNDLTAKSLITKLERFFLSIEEQEHIKKYRFISAHSPDGATMVETVLNKTYNIAVQMQEQANHIMKLETAISQKLASDEDHSLLNAAHERTDCELTPEGQAHDDKIMEDDTEWE